MLGGLGMERLRTWVERLREWSGLLCFVFLVATTLALTYVFVYRQWHLVEDSFGFAILVIVLIGLAFLFSSVEAGFSVSNRDPSVSDALNPELAALAQQFAPLAEKGAGGIDALTPKERRHRNRLERRSENLAEMRRILLGNSGRRIDIVGSLSALSVIVNTALAAFLPGFLASSTPFGLPLGAGELDGGKMLIFVGSALPIIYFGKIIPKTVGLKFPVRFAYRLYRVGNFSFFLIGWMPRGLNWLLKQIKVAQ